MTGPIVSDSPTIQATGPTAIIIAFPAPAKPVPPQPEDRLARALESLNTAMMEQRAAMAAWRGALEELKSTTTSLEDSLQRYRANLRSVGSSVSALQTKARELEQWADGVAAD